MKSKLPDLLFGSDTLDAAELGAAKLDALGKTSRDEEAQLHLAACDDCRKELEELRATMALLDSWKAPEPNPYFLTRLNARLEEERQAVPASWFERLRARLVYGSRYTLRPIAAMAMTAVVLVGGGTYLGLNHWDQPAVQPVQAAVVHDLQTMDSNAQLLDQLEALSDQPDQPQDQSDPPDQDND
jgi:predicted anti-sigma-YlaC factor YlaD